MRSSRRPSPGAGRFVFCFVLLWIALSGEIRAAADPLSPSTRFLSLGLGVSPGAFHSCPAFSLAAVIPLSRRIGIEGEFSYAFNPDREDTPLPSGSHRSSAGLGLTIAARTLLGNPARRLKPFLGVGGGSLYLSSITDRPDREREIRARNRLVAVAFAGLSLSFRSMWGVSLEARHMLMSEGEGRTTKVSAAVFIGF